MMANQATPDTPAIPGAADIAGIPATAGIADASGSAAPNFMTQIQQLTQFGAGKDTQFSDAAHTQTIQHISTFRDRLAEHRATAAAFANYGQVGDFFSAGQAKYHLTHVTNDVTRLDAFVTRIDHLHSYLDQLEKAVHAAFARMHAQDHAK
jgi:iron-sulfur cluster repair protein YtfE (RIC family)